MANAKFFQLIFYGHILSSKLLGKSCVERKGRLDVTTNKPDAKSVDEAKMLQQVEHEVKERRNGYQKISTDAYYRTERRVLHDGGDSGLQDSLETEGEIDGTPYSERGT